MTTPDDPRRRVVRGAAGARARATPSTVASRGSPVSSTSPRRRGSRPAEPRRRRRRARPARAARPAPRADGRAAGVGADAVDRGLDDDLQQRARGRGPRRTSRRRAASPSCRRSRSAAAPRAALELARHRVELLAQRGELVVALGRDLDREVAAAQPPRGLQEPVDLALQRARHRQRERERREDEEAEQRAVADAGGRRRPWAPPPCGRRAGDLTRRRRSRRREAGDAVARSSTVDLAVVREQLASGAGERRGDARRPRRPATTTPSPVAAAAAAANCRRQRPRPATSPRRLAARRPGRALAGPRRRRLPRSASRPAARVITPRRTPLALRAARRGASGAASRSLCGAAPAPAHVVGDRRARAAWRVVRSSSVQVDRERLRPRPARASALPGLVVGDEHEAARPPPPPSGG